MTEPAINVVMAIILLVMTVLWFREGRLANLSLLSQYSRMILVFVAILGAITSFDRLQIGIHGESQFPIPTIAAAFRLAILIILGGLIITAYKLRKGGL